MFRSKRRGRNVADQGRHLSEIRKRTQTLIRVANLKDHGVGSPAPASGQNSAAVRSLRGAEQALLESVHSAIASGLDADAIRVQGIDRAVSVTIAMSDLAYRVVGAVRARVGDLALS